MPIDSSWFWISSTPSRDRSVRSRALRGDHEGRKGRLRRCGLNHEAWFKTWSTLVTCDAFVHFNSPALLMKYMAFMPAGVVE